MITPPNTRRPIPTNALHWMREVRGIRRFLAELREMDQDLLNGWAAKQRAYYEARLADLLSHQPPRKGWRKVK